MKHKDVIGLFPNVPALAREIGQKPATVYKWSARDRIPDKFWIAVIDAAERQGVDLRLEHLAQASADRAA